MTPQEQHDADVWLTRYAEVIYRHECLGETQIAIAQSMRLSKGRGCQLYQKGKRAQMQGFI